MLQPKPFEEIKKKTFAETKAPPIDKHVGESFQGTESLKVQKVLGTVPPVSTKPSKVSIKTKIYNQRKQIALFFGVLFFIILLCIFFYYEHRRISIYCEDVALKLQAQAKHYYQQFTKKDNNSSSL